MTQARIDPAAAQLADGRVLVVGGYGPVPNGGYDFLANAEVYNPTTRTFSPTGNLIVPGAGGPSVTLSDGRVLVVSTRNDGSAELYDPTAGTFSVTGSLNVPRNSFTATLLSNGKVLIAGGQKLSSAELYDPATGTFSLTGSMDEARGTHTATPLTDGRVLIAGGLGPLASAEIYDPATGIFTATGNMSTGRSEHTATRLPSGRVLVAGGVGGGDLISVDIYDPTTGVFVATHPMREGRAGHSSTLLPDGTVLIAGSRGSFPASAELFYEQTFVDIVPPTITVPADITVAAVGSDGAAVNYLVSASDNVDPDPSLECVPPSESLFAVGTTTVTCTAIDTAGNEATATFQVTVLPPFDIDLAIDRYGSVSAKTGIATVRGGVSCNRDARIYLSGELKQTVANRVVVVGYFYTELDCLFPATAWNVSVSTSSGRYSAGSATASVTAYSCDQFSCNSAEASERIVLRGGK